MSDISAPTRPDRRRARNRDAILSAAETLFGARGIDGVSIDEIADAADIAKGTVYNHFADKDALASEIAAQARGDGEARVAAANQGLGDPIRRTVRGVIVFAHFAWERPERARAMMRLTPSAADPFAPVNDGVRADVSLGLSNEAFHGELESATLMVLGTAYTLIAHIAAERMPQARALELTRNTATLMLLGLGVPREIAISTAAAEAADIFSGVKP